MKLQEFYEGQSFDAYGYFGAHKEKDGVMFRTYAPGAAKVTVFGEFNHWTEEEMQQDGQSGVYELKSAKAEVGMMYKYCIYAKGGWRVEHCDPYGFGMELRPNSASYIVDLSEYRFHDAKWMKNRDKNYNRPLNIYEVHLGSWRTNEKDANGWYRYHEIADQLIMYAKENGYTHLEFLPLSEHPADCSWGYQNTGYFSPTSRYGTARDLMELVDKCHQAGIGVIMDFVPIHFATDYYGLANYDGTQLYEYVQSDVTDSEWGTRNFDYSRREVCCFLQSAAMGPVVALIGLELSGTAASNAGLIGDQIETSSVIVFLVTLGTAVFGSILFRKFLSVIPILIAVIAGYIAAIACGIVDFSEVAKAPILALPNFSTPKFSIDAILIILPVILVITSEHIGHQIVTSKIVGRDLLKDPGLHRSLFGDNFSTMISGLIGSVPTTTYGENIGVMAVTRVYSVYVIAGAAVLSIICSFVGKLSTLIQTIPGPVLGGISFLLYGMIGTSGIRILVDSNVDYAKSRNLALTSVIFVTGLSGIAVKFGNIELTGMVLACVVGMILSLIFYVLDKFHLTNDTE